MIKLKDLIMESKHPNPRLGLCYKLSGRYVSQHQDAILVHGRLTNPFAVGHPELDHAWVEEGDEILDPVMDKRWPKEVYESLFKTKVYKKYTFREVIQIINKNEHWGPWDDMKRAMPNILYHATIRHLMDEIEMEGLLPQKNKG